MSITEHLDDYRVTVSIGEYEGTFSCLVTECMDENEATAKAVFRLSSNNPSIEVEDVEKL